MSGDAIIMMLVATCTIWGGLVLAVINLVRTPEAVDGDPLAEHEL